MKKDDLENEFKKRLDLYNKGRLPAREKARLDAQLDDFRKQDAIPLEFTPKHSDELWKKISAQTINKKSSRGRIWLSVAAAIVFASVAALLMLSWNHDTAQLSNKLILKDGTIVWLKDNAVLEHSQFTVDNRQVTLSGEALFEVASSKEHPFIIHCGDYEARVVGTSFNISAGKNSVEVTVLTGVVKISSIKTDTSVFVNPREHVVFSENLNVKKTSPGLQELTAITANTQYDMHFEDTRMADVVKRIESKFDVTINLENTDIGNCMISADFTDQSLPLTLSMISEALGFQYEIDENNVIISGAGCRE